jgi:hypothetical protein
MCEYAVNDTGLVLRNYCGTCSIKILCKHCGKHFSCDFCNNVGYVDIGDGNKNYGIVDTFHGETYRKEVRSDNECFEDTKQFIQWVMQHGGHKNLQDIYLISE